MKHTLASAAFPTPEHEESAQSMVRFFTSRYKVDAVLLVNSCARGRATRDSCVDVVALAEPGGFRAQSKKWEEQWREFAANDPAILACRKVGVFSEAHPDFIDGDFAPRPRDETGGPDSFELEIGNFVAYSRPLWQSGDYYERLKAKWLPYYGEELRSARLAAARGHCLNNLRHIPLYLERGLYFQAFDRLYDAYREFLQALFISRRTYPIAYNKWIREQVEGILGLPELYQRLPGLFEIQRFESGVIGQKAVEIEEMLATFAA